MFVYTYPLSAFRLCVRQRLVAKAIQDSIPLFCIGIYHQLHKLFGAGGESRDITRHLNQMRSSLPLDDSPTLLHVRPVIIVQSHISAGALFIPNLLTVIGILLFLPDKYLFHTPERLDVGDERAGHTLLVPIPRIRRSRRCSTNQLIVERHRAVDDKHPIIFQDTKKLFEEGCPVLLLIPDVSSGSKGWVDVDKINCLVLEFCCKCMEGIPTVEGSHLVVSRIF